MKSQCDNQAVLQKISYRGDYPYFGSVSARRLSNAYRQFRNREDTFYGVKLHIGQIDGNIICNALWHEMSFNPVRFGTVSPFVLNGRNNIYAFCDGRINIDMGHGTEIVFNIRKNLGRFLRMNALPNGRWQCNIPTDGGYVCLDRKMYSMLACLRDCIKIIARQNVTDFRDKNGPYRDSIYKMVMGPCVAASFDDINDIAEDRQDRYLELLDSIIDAPSGYDADVYVQAMAEKERFFTWLANSRQR
ncbi:hypothetical protein HDR61_00360 [bacterium]|nr:hypothetical protein [bacterium]